MGRRVARILKAGDVPYLAIESDKDRVLEGRQSGFPVFYGDASEVDVLRAAGARRAGATFAISETLEASLHIGEGVLGRMGVPKEEASVLIDAFRSEYYD